MVCVSKPRQAKSLMPAIIARYIAKLGTAILLQVS
jgi:hypothetical protein